MASERSVTCPHCQAERQTRAAGGMKLRCPACGGKYRAPGVADDIPEGLVAVAATPAPPAPSPSPHPAGRVVARAEATSVAPPAAPPVEPHTPPPAPEFERTRHQHVARRGGLSSALTRRRVQVAR